MPSAMKRLFGTKTKRTSYRTQPRRVGYVHTSKAKTRLKRWFRRGRKKLWRTAKRRVRNKWKQQQRKRQRATHHRAIAPIAPIAPPSYQLTPTADGYQATPTSPTGTAGQAQGPPPDGVVAACRRCSHEVQYNGGRQRWEHTGRGHTECFKPHRI